MFTTDPDALLQLQKKLNPGPFREIYEKLKIEQKLVKNTDKPLEDFDKHNKFRRIYQNELKDGYDPINGKRVTRWAGFGQFHVEVGE